MDSSADCNDLDGRIGPLAVEELCNGEDENCDGLDDCDSDRDGAYDHSDPAPENPSITGSEEVAVDQRF